jgi:hypothetical protein
LLINVEICKFKNNNSKGENKMSGAKLWIRNMYTGPGEGMHTYPDSNPYMAIHPTWPLFAIELRKMKMVEEAEIIENALRSIG